MVALVLEIATREFEISYNLLCTLVNLYRMLKMYAAELV